MLDVHRLRVFRSVVASGSIAAAAANLGYTPSAISQHVAALQRETGLVLLERAGRGLVPTPVGLAVAAQADAVLARLGEAETAIASMRAERTAHLSLAYISSVGSTWLPEVARRLTQAHPEVDLDLQLLEDSTLEGTERPDVQLVVGPGTPVRAGAGFDVHRLAEDPYRVLLPATHPLSGRREVELAELATDRWIDSEPRAGWCRGNLLEACTAAGFAPAFHVQAHDYAMSAAFVGAGLGITVLPALAAHTLPDGVRSVPVVRPTPTRTIHVVVRKTIARWPPALLVVDTLASMVETTPPRG
ncbi:DNA-binding transcriptional LysR family regulator [Kineococcus radiotolerans]|uniref:DNA-binding transcriptional LysR family regulator n=1 Tax=Kineococcus radiotolerans TaxID=131568 RepID=A0A7W4TQV1_KINRA|nr:LysR family transcriptional regulator [Kineococcus radiotolerans]MBB2903028.1 DNA-binding transcriptional LysR family regulator [Kineococcus radiotolerans]